MGIDATTMKKILESRAEEIKKMREDEAESAETVLKMREDESVVIPFRAFDGTPLTIEIEYDPARGGHDHLIIKEDGEALGYFHIFQEHRDALIWWGRIDGYRSSKMLRILRRRVS